MRPELNQTRLQIQSNDLDLVKTKNGLLPQLDLFLDFSKDLTDTEYAVVLRDATRDLEDDAWRVDVGAQFSYPIGNRAARARFQRAQFTREKSEEALANLMQLVEQDVRGAYVELARAQEQIAATAATRRLQEVVEQTEREKFRIGTSTGILVAQAQRDLLAAQINEVQAVKNFLKALVNLYRLDGSLLLRRGIICPGAEPVQQ
jgi:outer membrane protein TolC